uniref:UDP-glycosyltransferases domain-containing protein n=1 Tax=Odontella aurita TaxID=265563 RepID=A0A7S4I558_9STRA|mmetsp:Transcript_20132/g.58212  ORF Transcript_20132/g.58212 Transcript_20132/m.58212 type:complete len:545 (+) Transcript_20132:598-2232(+)
MDEEVIGAMPIQILEDSAKMVYDEHLPFVLFVSVNNGSHLPTMSRIAKEMALRGFARVSVASNDEARPKVREAGLDFVSAGPTPDVSYEETIVFNPRASPFKVLSALQSFWGKFNGVIFEALEERWSSSLMNANLNNGGKDAGGPPDFLVCNSLTTACHDLAELFQLPYATITAHPIGILGLASSFDVHMAHYLPMEFTVFSRSIKTMGWFERVVSPLGKQLLQLPFRSDLLLLGERNALRARHGLPPVSKWLAATRTKAIPSGKALTIIGQSWALDYPAPLPPFMQMVGPIVEEAGTGSDSPSTLEPKLRAWLDQALEASATVVYCSFSTAVVLDSADAERVVKVASRLPASFRLLWSLRDHEAALDGLGPLPANLRLEEHIAQAEVLAHPAVGVFWSHMGTGGTYESVLAGVPLLAMPFYADQSANARHAVDRGVALEVDPRDFGASDAVRKLVELTGDPSFSARARKLGRLVRHEGGARRAVDLLHTAIEEGSEHLVPELYRLPRMQHHGLDIWVTWIAFALMGTVILLRLRRCKQIERDV